LASPTDSFETPAGPDRRCRPEPHGRAFQSAGENPTAEDLCADLHFLPASETAEGDVKAYHDTLRRSKPYLQRVVELAPDSDTAAQASEVLRKLNDE
jgi:methylphosphotriester-DNA--protein-cysteine methyltransferase